MNGIFLVNKEKHLTSRQVVEKLKQKLMIKKAGHAGTLDPLATGLLIVCVNQATKIAEIFSDSEKEYLATAQLGAKTDTADLEGKTIKKEKTFITKEELLDTLQKFPQEYQQKVPKFSATKVAGKRLYQYARENSNVILPTKKVLIKKIELISFDYENQIFKIKALVSKGTYIRSLIEDIANHLKTIAVMTDLIRTKQFNYAINEAKTISNIEKEDLIFISKINFNYPKIVINENQIKNGQIIDNIYQKEKILFVNKKNESIAIYQVYKKNQEKLKPWKMLKSFD